MLNRSKTWAATLLLAVFAAGVAAGGTVWSTWGSTDSNSDRRPGGPRGDHGRGSYAEHMQQELGLTVEQRAAVDSILAQNDPILSEAWSQMRARLDTIRHDVSDQIMVILDEEQQEQFRELIARSNRRGERERAPRNH